MPQTYAEIERTNSARLLSVDALRGFDMAWITGLAAIFRALQGMGDNGLTRTISGQLEHADWYGLHFYDLIFPLFLFVVGVGAAFSLDKRIAAGSKGSAMLGVVRRAALIYLIGVLFNGGWAKGWGMVRWIGVLQEIGECYLIAGLFYCLCGRRLAAVAAAIPCLLLLHWSILRFAPFPDLTFTPEAIAPIARRLGTHDPAAIAASQPVKVHGAFDHAHNFANYLDFRFLPGKKPEPLFAWEGLLSPMSACTLCLLGILGGRCLKSRELAPGVKLRWLLLGGVGLIAVGLLWSFEMPVVKKLWSSSFCLVSGGYCALLLGGFHWLVDLKGCNRWCGFLVWIGANPITIYLLSELFPYRQVAARVVGGPVTAWLDRQVAGLGAFAIALTAFIFTVLVARFLYRRKIFLRI